MTQLDVPYGRWRKSSHSDGGTDADCVEVAPLVDRNAGRLVGIRDSKNPGGPVLSCDPSEWSAFLGMVKHLD